MKRAIFIGQNKFFARARARIYRSAIALSICLVCPIVSSLAQEPQFILGQDSIVHGVALDHSQEPSTRNTLEITNNCALIKTQAAAVALVGSDDASIDARIKSTRGVIVLEGMFPNVDPKVLNTTFLSPYKNYAKSIQCELGMQPGPRYSLAMTIAAKFTGSGSLVLRKGDYVIVHADGQLFAYALPEITIPSEGVLRLYLGTDDKLYYDAALMHQAHSGTCGSQNN